MSDERAHAEQVALNPWMPEQNPIRLAILGKLGEETGELSAAVSRCMIQGADESEPVTKKPNKEWIEDEIADVLALIHITIGEFGLDSTRIEKRRSFKIQHVYSWLKLIYPAFAKEGEPL